MLDQNNAIKLLKQNLDTVQGKKKTQTTKMYVPKLQTNLWENV